MVVNCPPKEICGYPMSSGFAVTPSSPVCDANGFPALGLVCPPGTVRKPKRASFNESALHVWVHPAAPFTEWVLRFRPKPGNRLSCSTPEPNGSNPRASKTDRRGKEHTCPKI